jgi:hypothetical protein
MPRIIKGSAEAKLWGERMKHLRNNKRAVLKKGSGIVEAISSMPMIDKVAWGVLLGIPMFSKLMHYLNTRENRAMIQQIRNRMNTYRNQLRLLTQTEAEEIADELIPFAEAEIQNMGDIEEGLPMARRVV